MDIGLEHAGLDGLAEVLARRRQGLDNNQEDSTHYRLDLATGKFENIGKATDPGGKQISAYGMPDRPARTTSIMLEFGGTSIGTARRQDARGRPSGRRSTRASRPRRGRVDEQDRLWFAEYGANGIGMFDPKTETIKEWRMPTPWSAPYDVVSIKDGARCGPARC